MTDATTEKHTDEPMAAELSGEKKGRGPTRAAVKFADVLDDIHDSGLAKRIAEDISGGLSAEDARADVKVRREDLKRTIEVQTAEIEESEARASILARVEALPAHLRVALVAALSAKPAEA